MRPKNEVWLIGLLFAAIVTTFNYGCGGGSASPPPAVITVSLSQTSATVQAGATQQFLATVNNDPNNRGVTWSITPATGAGTLSNMTSTAVTYNAPANAPTSNLSATITAISVADTSKSAAALVTVPEKSAIVVSVTPVAVTIQSGSGLTIAAAVTNDPTFSGVNWTISPAAGGGTLSETATLSGTVNVYTAPTLPSGTLNVTVTATSVADHTKSASIAVTVTTGLSVSVSASSWADDGLGALIQVGGTIPFSAVVNDDPNSAGVTWSIAGCTGGPSICGSIINVSNSGPYTADYVAPPIIPTGGQVNVVATSVTDPTKSASGPVTVSPINFVSQNYPAGNTPKGVALADFNGDGKLDVAVADYGNPSAGDNGGISILLNNGDGTFQPASLVAAGKNPFSIAVGDFNKDGKQDLVVAAYGDRSTGGSGSISVLLGNGDGTFQAPLTLSAGNEPFALVSGDFNGDGRSDFAVSDVSSGVYVFLGNGNGTFNSPAPITTGNNPSALVATDLNDDGKLDLAVAGSGSSASTVNVLLGHGDGTLAPAVPYALNGFLPTSIVAVDLNGDGKLDLAITTYGCVFGVCRAPILTLLGNGDGIFQSSQLLELPAPASVILFPPTVSLSLNAADFRGDGRTDLVEVIGSSVALFPGIGDGTFQGVLFYGANQNPYAQAIGDLNGDGKADIVVANSGSNDITILLNTTGP